MTFIPNPEIINVGDRVILTADMKVASGTFTMGHEFTVVSVGERGLNLQDDEGREVGETSPHEHHIRKKLRRR